jgi:hypothetical protein
LRKKSWLVIWAVDRCFYRGFWEKACAACGDLRGKTWWDCGENVVENDIKFALKDASRF